MNVVCQRHHSITYGSPNHFVRQNKEYTTRNFRVRQPSCTAAINNIELARPLIPKDTIIEETKEGFSLTHAAPENIISSRERSGAKPKVDEQKEHSKLQVGRSMSFSEFEDTVFEEKLALYKFALSERMKARSNVITGHFGYRRICPTRKTSSSRSLRDLGPSGDRHIPWTDEPASGLGHCRSLRCSKCSNEPYTSTHTCNWASRSTVESNGQPLPAKRTHTSTESSEHNLTKKTTRRRSRILETRFELELAINKGEKSKLLSAIEWKALDLDEKDYYGKTLLHTACSVGNYHCAQILINAGADVNIQDYAGFTPLHCAVVSNHVPCAALLISSGADLTVTTRTMHTALTLAHEDEMILLIGRSLLLRETLFRKRVRKKDCTSLSLRETNL